MKRVLIPLAEGFEEIEFIAIADVLRRASQAGGGQSGEGVGGLEVLIASLTEDKLVCGANGIKVQADFALDEILDRPLDAIALAGGFGGMSKLKKDERILGLIRSLHAEGRVVAAICASPIVLDAAGVLEGDFACYPGCEAGLAGQRVNRAVVVNKKLITSAGPATALLFALELVRALCGEESYAALYEGLLLPLARA